jgi:CRISPR/Cas system CSM-associated protein Csm3 (group 7 of RAMP superfamily)
MKSVLRILDVNDIHEKNKSLASCSITDSIFKEIFSLKIKMKNRCSIDFSNSHHNLFSIHSFIPTSTLNTMINISIKNS